jgi:hypothetical protein
MPHSAEEAVGIQQRRRFEGEGIIGQIRLEPVIF